ncbi:hypothetical protein R6Q59_028749 [Mikania micrantha]|uniref:BHLH domain-containing protein n=1 Tax=Mikania micrantha TaxID=192012 RepID=A0A5N6LXM2_9ASTR|nr:hypothetical protein E3N88_44061 [Mikania micrantha]KAD2806260.1 hypothetical protein E3N88_39637 [Mikania micrantha]
MEDLGWERNMWLPWSNINHHLYQQDTQESFIFGSQDIFLNPIQDITLNPITAAGNTGSQMGSQQLAPAKMNSNNNVASNFGPASQYWPQTSNGISSAATDASLESLDCLLSGTNSNADTSSDHDDGISVIFPDYKNLCNTINNLTGVSRGDSVTKEIIDDGIVSQCSSGKKPNHNSGFSEDYQPRSKKPKSDPGRSTSSNINFRQGTMEFDETDSEAIAQMKEMIYRAAAFRPVSFADEEVMEKPKRKNVRISSDPQTVAARQRREKISERIRVLQKLVPGGNKMDTASMLDEAANYLKFLRSQVKALEQFGEKFDYLSCGTTTNAQSTSQIIQNIGHSSVTIGVPFPMQTRFLLPHQQLYLTPHHA